MPPKAIKMLLIDDEPDVLDVARQFLEGTGGFEVHACRSGREALAALDAGSYEAVVADYAMPDMDGLDLLREVRASFGRMPFILLTGKGREDVAIDALNNGADFYLRKGGDPSLMFADLARKVQQAAGRRNAEEALRGIEERYRLITDNTADGIWMTDMDLNVTYASRSILAMRGCSEAELKSMKLSDHLTPRSHEKAMKALGDELAPERLSDPSLRPSKVIELEFKHRDGTVHLSEERITLIRDAEGSPLGLLGVGRIISGRAARRNGFDGEGQDGTAPARTEADRRMGILSDITRHDILNQLTVIGLTANILKQRAGDDRTLRQLEILEGAAENIHQQIKFCREYEKVGSSAPCWQSLAEVARHALGAAEERDLGTAASLGRWELFADPMLGKVFDNLVDNSLRHGEKVGRIAIDAVLEGGDLMVDYTDDGVGIAEREKGSLFTKGYGKNNGLGLFMVKEILGITGIGISEDGVPGQGVRFRIRAPLGKHRERSG